MAPRDAAEAKSTVGASLARVDAHVGAGRSPGLEASVAAARLSRAGWARSLVVAWAACLAVGLGAGPAQAEEPAGERKRVAVLELVHAGPLADDVLRVSADMVRGAALKQLPRSAWQVMTRENILAMLPPGTDLSACVGDCEVETGRRLGAWLVVTGEVAQLGTRLTVALKAHQTERGELVAQSAATSATTEGLFEAAQAAATDLFAQVAQPAGRAPAVGVPMLGPTADIGALAAQAERLEAERRAAAGATRRAEEAAAALAAAKAAEVKRLVAEAQVALRAEVARDFGAIQRLVAQPSEAGRAALEAFVARYGAATVQIEGTSHPVAVPEVVTVKQALAAVVPDAVGKGGAGGEGAGRLDLKWVRFGGGAFSMGSDDGIDDDDTDLDDGWANERPRRRVWVPGFELMTTEVTVAHYRACVEAGHCAPPKTGRACNWGQPKRENHPINCVDWAQAWAFAQWVGGRLPSEAEWEFAARSGGRDQRYTWGDRPADQGVAVMKGALGTAPVCSKVGALSLQGVCDLAGNVWEWVADWYGPYPEAPSDGSARTQTTQRRVARGGSWRSTSFSLRAAYRDRNSPGTWSDDLGFRVAR